MSVRPGAGPTEEDPGWSSGWLDLRADADDRARSASLLDALARLLPPDAHVLDVGCGAGAMQRWCAGRLPSGTRWSLLDPDARLLDLAVRRAVGPAGGPTPVRLLASVDALADLLDGGPGDPSHGPVDAVVCSALLDVLTAAQVERLVATTVAAGVPLLVALTVTGTVALDPPDPDDATARAGVDHTSVADGAVGPGAARLLADRAVALGARVHRETTPWLLRPDVDAALLGAWLDGYAAAARLGARAGTSAGALDRWAGRRRAQADRRTLTVRVDHEDVLVVPR